MKEVININDLNSMYKQYSYCGDINSHAHHKDYFKPLDVIWLCVEHHKFLHRSE